MMRVDFYRGDDDDPFGAVEYDADADEFTIDPRAADAEEVLRRVLADPVFATVGGELVDVYASRDPVLFMTSLAAHYKSGQGLRASAVEADDEDILEDEE